MAVPERELDRLACAYAMTRDSSLRERLCEAALPLVRRLAALVLRRLPSHFTIDDLIGDGCIGLLRAIDRFDPAYEVAFETWATRIVRGSMLNGLRRMDAVPERVRRDARSLDSARWRLAMEAGAAPRDRDAAADAGLSAQKLQAIQMALRSAATLSLDAPINGGMAPDGASLGEFIAADDPDPADRVVETDLRLVLARVVASLSARDRHIVAAFYSGNTTFREIGNSYGISKQRVSQLHNRALEGMRKTLAAMQFDV
jgi:RNA polymerase sigma factor for flagellar operon FliA